MKRSKLVVGNWKMHGSYELCRKNVPILSNSIHPNVELVLCPPAPFLGEVAALASGSKLAWGGQDASVLQYGARTGEWSAAMLVELGCRYAIVGHSERRQYHGESDLEIASKAQACLEVGVIPIFCVGETESERKAGKTEAVLIRQLSALFQIPKWEHVVIAYEPVWAIGTGLAATPEMAQQAHAFIRKTMARVNQEFSLRVPILYGGSVKPSNAAELFAMADIDGGLVGGSSIEAESLLAIYQAA